ncbi:hypothetical protein MBLNU13_g00193t1 [Cladosporium sp. NU13]
MSPTSFLDKLAPELRVAIYSHVLGLSKVMKPSNSTASLGIDNDIIALSAEEELKHTTIEVGILATNKLIHKEATQVLYHNRTFRATFPELERLLQHENFVANVEFVEVADCANTRKHADLSNCSSILKRLQRLPRIRSIAILSDCLSGLVPHHLDIRGAQNLVQHIAVPYFIQNVAELGHTTCIDIGRYKLHGEYSGVEVVNRKLTAMWLSAQAVPSDYDAWADLESLMQQWQILTNVHDQLALTLQTSFRCWVGLHEELASMETSGRLLELSQQDDGSMSDADKKKLRVAGQWADATLHSRLSSFPHLTHTSRVPEPRTLNLRHLKAGDDPNALSWATEYLAANVAVFRCDPRSNVLFENVAAQHWVEADGGMHTIERRIQHQKLAFAGLPNPSYVLEPVRKASLIAHAAVQYQITSGGFDRLATQSSSGALEPLEFVQLARLCLAMFPDHGLLGLPTDVNYSRERDEWASDYLKRHLLVSEWANPDVVQEMSVADMRSSLLVLLQRPPQSLNEIRTAPPKGLDADLFLPLAWKWSWEYASICIERHEAGQESESSSDWEESGSEMASDSEGED